MDELINQLVSKVGIDRATAEKVANFLKDNATEIPKWIGGNAMAQDMLNKMPGGLGNMFGKKD